MGALILTPPINLIKNLSPWPVLLASLQNMSGTVLINEPLLAMFQVFVESRAVTELDYCNSLLYGITDRLMQRVQSVQNAAARLVTGAHQSDHITPVLHQLHWLAVWQCVDFKVIRLVFQSLTGQAPVYHADECRLVKKFLCHQPSPVEHSPIKTAAN